MFPQLLEVGLKSLLQLPVVKKLADQAQSQALKIIQSHFKDSSKELGGAFQNSYNCALAAIASGVAPQKKLRRVWIKFAKSRISREFSEKLHEHYLTPFTQEKNLLGEHFSIFQRQTASICLDLSKKAEALFPLESFEEPDWVVFLSEDKKNPIAPLLLEHIQKSIEIEISVFEFLAYRDLLGDSVMYFFRENMRKKPRVEKTLAALQREGLWVDIRDLKEAQAQMQQSIGMQLSHLEKNMLAQRQAIVDASQQGNFALISELSEVAQSMKQQHETQQRMISDLPFLEKTLTEAQAEWEAYGLRLNQFEKRFGSWCEVISIHSNEILKGLEKFDEELKRTRKAAEEAAEEAKGAKEHANKARTAAVGAEREARGAKKAIVNLGQDLQGQFAAFSDQIAGQMADLYEMMNRIQLSPKIKARDEFSQHSRHNIALIRKIVRALDGLPLSTKGYSIAAITLGSALSSCGDLEKASLFLKRGQESAENNEEKALASYDLFHIFLRQGNYDAALEALERAIELNPEEYMLHNVEKYPIERILGAGGMGCAFLCREHMWNDKVVVKSFWEARKGPIRQVFSEVLTMARVASQYVPKPLDYGYVLPMRQERPFIVMKHIEDAIDGEAWLQEYGPMELIEGVGVGIEVAKGLQIAHQAGVSHLDLKPANLLLRRIEGHIEVKIIDFGLSRVATSLKEEAIAKSRTGKSVFVQEIFGTLDYAPPEQLGEIQYGKPGPHSDLFSFGATLYRLMSGENPRTINPRCLPDNRELFDLLALCMMRSPKRRPGSAGEVVEHLEKIKQDASLTPSDRFQDVLAKELEANSLLQADDEIDLLGEGRALGLKRGEARAVLQSFMQRHGIRRKKDGESGKRNPPLPKQPPAKEPSQTIEYQPKQTVKRPRKKVEEKPSQTLEYPRAARATSRDDFQKALELEKSGEINAALRLYEKHIKNHPQDVKTRRRLADLYIEQKNWGGAQGILEMLLQMMQEQGISEENYRYHYMLALTYENLGHIQNALYQYQESYNFNPTYFPTLNGLGRIYYAEQEWERSLKVYQTILYHHRSQLSNRELSEVYYRMALAYDQMNSPEQALDYYEQALEIDPANPQALRCLVGHYEARNDWERSLELKERLLLVLDNDEERLALTMELGQMCHQQLGRPLQAIDFYRQAFMLTSENPQILYRLLELYEETQQWLDMIDTLEQLIQLEQDTEKQIRYNYHIAELFQNKLHNAEYAVQYYNRVLDINCTYDAAFQAIETLLFNLQQWQMLDENYRLMLKRLPQDESQQQRKLDLWRKLGDLYRYRFNNIDNAVMAYELVYKMEPSVKNLEVLAELYGQKDEFRPKAVEIHHELLRRNPARIESYKSLIRLYYELQQYDRSFATCSTLRFLRETSPEEEQFFESMKAKAPDRIRRAFRESDIWKALLMHDNVKTPLAEILGVLYQFCGADFAKTTKEFKLKQTDKVDPNWFFSRTYDYVAQVLGLPQPVEVYQSSMLPGLRVVNTFPPVVLAGADMFKERHPKELLFMIARQLTFSRPEFLFASVLSHGEFRALLSSFFNMYNNSYPLDCPQNTAAGIQKRLSRSLPQERQDHLGRLVQAYLQDPNPIQPDQYLEGVEHTANRVGFCMAGDLNIASTVCEREVRDDFKIPHRLKVKELVLYSISEKYHIFREKQGLAVKL